MRPLLVAALAICALVAVAAARPSRSARPSTSPLIYPAQHVPLAFSHQQHLARRADCQACHPGASSSRSAFDNLMPTERECTACHAVDRARPEGTGGAATGRCVACHPSWRPDRPVERLRLLPPEIKFSHAAHRASDCAVCHGDLRTVDLAGRDALPAMASCLTCHDGAKAPAACTTCHLADVAGRVRTKLFAGRLAPESDVFDDDHGPDFLGRHGRIAGRADATCSSCHAESECSDCHLGVAKPLSIHPGNYAQSHAVDARRGAPDCAACHRQQSFCVACHERTGVSARIGEFDGASEERRFHPPGWTALNGARHGVEARRSLDACASCHREDFCADCHSAEPGTPRINPHGPGWRASRQCAALAKRNPRMCSRCHIGEDEARCDR